MGLLVGAYLEKLQHPHGHAALATRGFGKVVDGEAFVLLLQFLLRFRKFVLCHFRAFGIGHRRAEICEDLFDLGSRQMLFVMHHLEFQELNEVVRTEHDVKRTAELNTCTIGV